MTKFGIILFRETDNIGDDIQTYAAYKFYPKVDYIIDRERMDEFVPKSENEKVSVIMNGWYLHNKFRFPFSPYINPLLTSVHFTKNGDIITQNYDFLDGYSNQFLKKIYGNKKIGCRDDSTYEILKQKGYNVYFSGCLTLTIGLNRRKKIKKYICAVDMSDEVINRLTELFPDYEIKKITHWLVPSEQKELTFSYRMKRVEKLLAVYQDAFLVITDRLHVSLPCLALNTNVLLLYDENTSDRIGTYLEYVNYVSKEEFFDLTREQLCKIKNSDNYLKIRRKLIKTCNDFVNNNENNNLINKLPRLDDYKDFIARKSHMEVLFINTIQEKDKKIRELSEETQTLWKDCLWYQNEIKRLEEYNQQISLRRFIIEKIKRWRK